MRFTAFTLGILVFSIGAEAQNLLGAGASSGVSQSFGASSGPKNRSVGIRVGAGAMIENTETSSEGYQIYSQNYRKKVGITADVLWNLGHLELGPTASYELVRTDPKSVFEVTLREHQYSVGGVVEFNFLENRPGQSFVPGVGLRGGYKKLKGRTLTNYDVFSLPVDQSGLFLKPEAFMKIFVGRSDLSVRLGVGYSYSTLEGEVEGHFSEGTAVTSQEALDLNISVASYF